MMTGCASSKPIAPFETTLSVYRPAKHLVFIGLDGWGAAYVPDAEMPAVMRMMGQGAWSLNVRSVMPSNSLPNWTALFTGVENDGNIKQTPSIFTLVKNEWPDSKTVFFFEWGELNNLCTDDETEKIAIRSDYESAVKAADYIRENKPLFTAVVFNEPDSAGHNNRWGSAAYYAKLAELDSFIAIIEQAVIDAGLYEDTVFVLSSDHGGVLWGHGFRSQKQRRIPLVIFGSGIKKGYEIPGRRSILDIAPAFAMILGLKIPDQWTGTILWDVFNEE